MHEYYSAGSTRLNRKNENHGIETALRPCGDVQRNEYPSRSFTQIPAVPRRLNANRAVYPTDGVHRTGSQEMRTTDESALRSCGAVLRNENHSRSCTQSPDCPRVLHAHRNEYHNRGCTQSCAHVVTKNKAFEIATCLQTP